MNVTCTWCTVLLIVLAGQCNAESMAVPCNRRWIEPDIGNPRVVLTSVTNPNGTPPGRWTWIDLTDIAPTGAEWVRLEGRLIISRGQQAGRCEIRVHWNGSPRWAGQAEAGTDIGVRAPWTTSVPLINGRIRIHWQLFGPGADAVYPAGCNAGINLWAVEWCGTNE